MLAYLPASSLKLDKTDRKVVSPGQIRPGDEARIGPATTGLPPSH